MTEYFEIGDRDGAARRGTLRLTDAVSTPAAVDDIVVDAGSRWHEPQSVPDGDESTLTVLPHRALPPGTEPPVEEAFAVDYPDVEYPSAAVVSPGTAEDYGADAYVLSNAGGYAGHAEAFVEAVLSIRRAIPDDTALYCPAVATPANVATLMYAGVDRAPTDRTWKGTLFAVFQKRLAVGRETETHVAPRPGSFFLQEITTRMHKDAEACRCTERRTGRPGGAGHPHPGC